MQGGCAKRTVYIVLYTTVSHCAVSASLWITYQIPLAHYGEVGVVSCLAATSVSADLLDCRKVSTSTID